MFIIMANAKYRVYLLICSATLARHQNFYDTLKVK